MDFPIDLLERIDILSRRVSGQLAAPSDRSISPESKSLLITLNKLNRNLRTIEIEQANPMVSCQVLQHVIKYFEAFLDDLVRYKLFFYGRRRKECVIVFQSRLEHFLESFDSVIYFDKSDLFSLPLKHERWERLRKCVEVHKYENPKEITEDLNFVMKNMTIGQAALADAYTASGSVSKFHLGFSALYYSIFQSSAFKKTELFHARPQLGIFQILYNIAETNFIGTVMNFIMPFISVNDQFFIPRTVSHIFQPLQYKNNDPSLQYTPGDNVSVRFLSNHRRFYNAVMIHIHGGGFIAMSSRSHQCYTRKWVRSLDIPCISIDYRLSPENRFPAALDDVWQVYNWVLRFGESKLNIRPDKVFLIGDSAGGNFALSLTYRILEENLKAPNGLLLGYPALNLSKKQFSFSMINSLEDRLVSLGFLKMCIEAYVPQEFSPENHFISPIRAPQRLLKQLPPVRIVLGDKDPLHDESWRFTEKLLDIGVDVKFCVFEGMIHGALNFCYKGGVRGSRAMVDKVEKWTQDLLARETIS